MRKKGVYLNFKNRQALNVAQAVACEVFERYNKQEGHNLGQVMSIKEGKKNIAFHFEQGMTIIVSLIANHAYGKRQSWLVKNAKVKYKNAYRGSIQLGLHRGVKDLAELKKSHDWGTPEVAGEETL